MTISHPVVPATVDDIDPGRRPAEIAASTRSSQRVVELLHTEHPSLLRGLPWAFHDDGAQLVLNPTHGDDDFLRGVVAVFAAALAVQVDERPREPIDDGYMIVSAVGTYRGMRIGVQATCGPDPAEGLDRIYRHFVAEDDTQSFPAIRDDVPREPLALPAPQPEAVWT